MRIRLIIKINSQLDDLSKVIINNNHKKRWELGKLVEKYRIILVFLEDVDIDLDKIEKVINSVDDEKNFFFNSIN